MKVVENGSKVGVYTEAAFAVREQGLHLKKESNISIVKLMFICMFQIMPLWEYSTAHQQEVEKM